MKKYQEALDILIKLKNYLLADPFEKRPLPSTDEIKESLNVLQELVDKETTMKPNNFDEEYCMYNCPNCSKVNATFKFSYCPHCGQKLDWSDK